ncbi:MAG TPA: hypothetical protein VHL57_11580, partial [Flavobacteriales bacterium]|nr:hypothetical protein [Flavobacteriales bacterium]
MTRRSALVLAPSLFAAFVSAQPFTWQWSVSATSTVSVPDIHGMATDADGNSYITGQFYGTATFGQLPPLTSAGESDVFVAKYDNSGQAVWAVRAGGTDVDLALGLDEDGQGHVYITGYFQSPTAAFGSNSLTLSGTMDIFCARLDGSNGNFDWSHRYGDNNNSLEPNEQGNAIACDADGNVYVTGRFHYYMTVPGLSELQGCSQYFTTFLMKLAPDGSGIWSRTPECGHGGFTLRSSEGQRLAVNDAGDLYLGFRYRGDTCFIEGDTLLYGAFTTETFDGVLVRYDTDGGYQWSRRIGGQGYDDFEAMDVDSEGACYSAMHREGTYSLPDLYEDFAGQFGYYKNVVFKTAPDGHVIWSDRIGNSSYDHGINGFKLDGLGNLYVGGWYDGHFEIEDYEPLPNTFGFSGLYAARFDTAGVLGDVFASRHFAGRGVAGLGLDASANVYISGYFRDTLAFPGLPTLEVDAVAAFVARSGDLSTALEDVRAN